ncbi:bestrophin-like domain [Mycobacterium sp. NPDC003449]
MGDFGVIGAWVLLAVVVVGAVALAVGIVLLASRVVARDTRPEHNSILSPFLTVVGLVYGAVLGFTVVVGWQQYLSAETNVSNEASTLTTMYRLTVAMPQPEQAQVREQLRTYADALQGPRWGKEEFAAIENEGRRALTDMYRIVGTRESNAPAAAVNSQFLTQLNVLASDRSARILNAKPRIPPLLWCALIFGSLVLVTLASFMRLASNRAHMILVGTVTALLALLLYLVFMLDHPYGPLGVTPHQFSHAVEVFDLVDQGT